MPSVSPTPLVVEQRVGGAEFLDLPCLDSGINLNLTSDDMACLRRQGIAVDYDSDPYPENIPDEFPHPKDGYSCKSKVIICLRRSKTLHNTYAAFKNYSHEEVMKMTKLMMTNCHYSHCH